MRDLYKELGVEKNASNQEIKKSYRQLARQLHPDKSGDQERMKLINEAYSVLSDSENRQRYDKEYVSFQNYEKYFHFFSMVRKKFSSPRFQNKLDLLSLCSISTLMLSEQEIEFDRGCYVSFHRVERNDNFNILKSILEKNTIIIPQYEFQLEKEKLFGSSVMKLSDLTSRTNYIEPIEFPKLLNAETVSGNRVNDLFDIGFNDIQAISTKSVTRYSFFAEGGVRIEPELNIRHGVSGQLEGVPVNLCHAGGSNLPPGNGGGTPPTTGGGSSGGGGGKPHRFIQLTSGANKAEVRALLDGKSLPISVEQEKAIRDVLGTGTMNSINIKKMHNGTLHVSCQRPGRTSGFQRMSFKIAENGVKLHVVQTAFDNDNNLVHQRPGASKNNLYDVKK